MTVEVGEHRILVGELPSGLYPHPWPRARHDGQSSPGAVTIGGLEPATSYDVCLVGPGVPRVKIAVVATLPPPPGRLLTRFATISDCHIGERQVGFFGTFHDPRPRPRGLVPYPTRCATAAIAEAERWGADLLVAKGDLTQNGMPAELFDMVDILRSATVPVEAILGNHDVRNSTDAVAVMAAGGVSVTSGARARDLPGVRLVLGHTPRPDRHAGRVPPDQAGDLARLAGEGGAPAVLALHHPPQRWPVETHYPPSISWRSSRQLVSALAAANPATLLIAGHTHRNRRYRVGGITVAEVGSTKDYPGQWAGYAVYEGGIRQVVFRVEEPSCVAWTERTREALGGVWGWWSPGRLADRCWTLEWPDRVVAAS
jgi:predicted phosphodiesterase